MQILRRQVAITGTRIALQLEWHKALLDGLFPTTIGEGSDNLLGYVLRGNISVKSKLVSGLNLSAMNMKISYKEKRVGQKSVIVRDSIVAPPPHKVE